MATELLILRHAKSDWQGDLSDFERPLNARGARDAPRMGRWLASQQLLPDMILSSPARRARQTIEAVCEQAQMAPERIQWIESLYLASLKQLCQRLSDIPTATPRVLLVGHNPGLEELLLYLASPPVPRKANGKLLTTAALAWLQLERGWTDIRPGCANLLQIQYPDTLGP